MNKWSLEDIEQLKIKKNEEEITWLLGDLGSVNIRPKTESIFAIFTAALFWLEIELVREWFYFVTDWEKLMVQWFHRHYFVLELLPFLSAVIHQI